MRDRVGPIPNAALVATATLLALCGVACSTAKTEESPATPPVACATLFGKPNAKTGLTDAQCVPSCACGDTPFTPPTYDDAFISRLVSGYSMTSPYAPLSSDPYAKPAPPPPAAGTVCAVLLGADAGAAPRPYSLATYASEAEARAAGAIPTHFGACGVCSTLANLAVYMREEDLTAPVRACGLQSKTFADDVACLEALGFDEPCADIWAYNTAHTRSACLSVCLTELNAPYHLPDGGLNPCIQCDEDESGAVFKATAGRTRRNSGLPNALCRPCSEVRPLVHAY